MRTSRNNGDKIFSKIFLYFLIFIILTLSTTSYIFYKNFEKNEITNISSFIENNLNQVSYSANIMSDTVKLIALQVYFDPDISKALTESNVSWNDSNIACNRLRTYQSIEPYIKSIYLYNSFEKNFYTSIYTFPKMKEEEFFDKDIINVVSDLNGYKQRYPISRKYSEPDELVPNKVNESYVYTFILRSLPFKSVPSNSTVVINVSENWIKNLISKLDIDKGSDIFIINNEGKLAIGSDNKPMLTDISGENYVKKMIKDNKTSDYFITNVNGTKSVVTYVSSAELDWKFVKIIPYENIIGRIDTFKMRTLIFYFLILIVVLLIYLFMYKRYSKPIDELIKKLKQLQYYKQNNEYIVKQKYLKDLLAGKDVHEEEVKDNFSKYEIQLNTEKPFMLIGFKIDNYEKFTSLYDVNDRELIRFGIMNVCSEIFKTKFNTAEIDFSEDTVVLVANVNNSLGDNYQSVINDLITKTQIDVLSNIKISLTASVSSVGVSVNELSLLLSECLNTMNYRVIYGLQSVIYYDNIYTLENKEYEYPQEKERLLMEALNLGNMDEVVTKYNNFIKEILNFSYNSFSNSLLNLSYKCYNLLISRAKQNKQWGKKYNYKKIIFKLEKAERLENINAMFMELFEQIMEIQQQKEDSRHDDLVESIIDIINKNYGDNDLCTKTIADKMNMSSVYLGSLFKKITTKSISQYICDVRLQNAKKALMETEKPINTISKEVGFSESSYFYKVFKKAYGETPSQYRSNN
ncbi:AraC-type DNA-binding protein [Clostridium amylolyticum]|uniref:AraC-type DNA-binding protein n=1 Tax=Clostridium amylolyticum TaxID=1121298 RepID=A0A1M6HA30_9CLOT|nr:helix-turn-helix domain-containing protein [Clostridium amylolyticum]SHJ19055.1 AraC-type DNA-binding protein [Clostridium amylolyticum]